MKPIAEITVPLSKFITVFQAKIMDIRTCPEKIRDRGFVNHHNYLSSEGQATLKALQSEEITSRLV